MTQAVIATTVTGLQGRSVMTTAPTAGQALTWNGSAWAPAGPFIPTVGGTVIGPLRYQFASPTNVWADTSVANTAGGLWRETVQGGHFYIQANTAAAGDFSTLVTPFTGDAAGNLSVGAALTVAGAGTFNSLSSVTVTASNNIQGANLVATNATYPGGGLGGSIIVGNAGRGWNWTDGTNSYNFMCQGPTNPVFVWQHVGVQSIMQLDSLGNLGISGTLTQSSDETLKTNISPLSQGISLIRQLIPKSFAWKETPEVTQWGFVAQDVQPVIPVAVAESLPIEGGGTTTTLTLDINAILAALTYAVKQIDERLSAVELHDGISPPPAQLA